MKILLHLLLAATAIIVMPYPENRAFAADSHPLLQQAERHMENRQYYHAITEIMRYQYLYPRGKEYYGSMLMMGKAYFLGDNYYQATQVMAECYNAARDTGEEMRGRAEVDCIRRVLHDFSLFQCQTPCQR